MIKEQANKKTIGSEAGFTLFELLVSTMLASLVLFGALQQYISTAQKSRDNQLRITTFLQAQAVVQNMGFEVRILGNGLPFDQAKFQIGEDTLADPTVTEPISIANTSATQIAFRMNETGDVFLLAQNFDPGLSSTIFLTDVESLVVNDPIYLSNSVVGGDSGLYGIVTGIDSSAKSITIGSVQTTVGATFDKGSLLEEVPLVTYSHDAILNHITRDSGFGAVVVAENATLAFDFKDIDGNSLTLPLTNLDVVNSLRSIQITVSVTSDKDLTTGGVYVSTVTQTFGLRNLNYLF